MKRIVLTDRDKKIIDFLNNFKCATTSTIANIFFNSSKRPCTRRLKNLREHGFIKSSQEFVSLEMIHYVGKKPTQIKHSCICSELIGKLYENNVDVLKTKVEFKIDSVRCDLFIAIKHNNKTRIFLTEICNTKKFDLNKYNKLYESSKWREYFPVFPELLIISDKVVETNRKFNFHIYDLMFNKKE